RVEIGHMAIELNEDQRARLDAEWAFLNATREMMNIARRKLDATTYKQAIRFGAAIAPGVLGEERRVIQGLKESVEAQTFRLKALAETRLQGRMVSPLELINKDIDELKSQTEVMPDAELLLSRLTILQKVRQEVTPKRVTENQMIFRDAIKTN